ncbi:TPA: leucyl/phenylalanyl-tRNA--protein transferase [Neisseria meningitidis]
MRIPLLAPDNYAFPDPAYALAWCDGLVGVSGDLDAGRLLEAYRNGVFPWFSRDGWFFWYAVGPRAVIVPERLHVPRSLAKTLRNGSYRVAVNGCFAEVVAHCAAAARPNQDGTWIAPEFQTAYLKLHEMGHAHSFECHYPDESGETRLAGGFYGVQIGRVFYGVQIGRVFYGVQIGRVFYGESMFALQPDASKIAFACAVPFLADLGVELIDCQQDTEHMRRFGSELLPFADFAERLRMLNAVPLKEEIGRREVACKGL